MKKLKFLLLSSLMAFVFQSYATHIVGGEIIYTCLGDNEYEVKLILYRDCFAGGAGFDAPACLALYDEDGGFVMNINAFSVVITPIEIVSPDPCLVIPEGLCIEQGVYTFNITLPSGDQAYDLVYHRCCRNPSIVNIELPESTGSTYWAHFPATDEIGCNSSPYFNELPPTAICISSDINFDHSATDPDGDSLVYRFFTPYVGVSLGDPTSCPPPAPPFAEIDWVAGFSEAYQVTATPALSIDPETGYLTGTPTAEGRYVVGIAVEEYRDGLLLETHYRDYQFNVQLCEPLVTAETAEFILNCENYTVEFVNSSTGADEYIWDFGDGTTSTLFEPTHTYADTGTYTVTLIALPGFTCADTFIATVSIYNVLTAQYTYTAGCSGTPVIFNDNSTSTEAGEIILWSWNFGDGFTSTEANPEHEYADGGNYDVVLTVTTDKGCVSTISYNILVEPGPDVDFIVEDVCQNVAAHFTNLTTITTGTVSSYDWDFGDGETSTEEEPDHFYDAPGTYTVTLIAFSSNGCSDTITGEVNIGELPFADAGPDQTVEYLSTFSLDGSGVGTFFWFPLNPIIFPANISSLTDADPNAELTETTTFLLTVTSPDGCTETDTVTIFVNQITIVEVPSAFSPNGDGINDQIYVLNHEVGELLEYTIFNRWGEIIFTTQDLNKGWDGSIEGNDAEIGTYVYLVRAIGLGGEFFQKEGNITLVR